jgi:hypothetical protein
MLYALWKNKKLTLVSNKNESHHLACQNKEYTKISSLCDDSCQENCEDNLLWIDTWVKQYAPSPFEWGYNMKSIKLQYGDKTSH